MRRLIQIVLMGFAASMLVFALSRAPDASASVAYVSPYTFDQTYGTALRLLRVDQGFKILEKDRELGYVVFEYSSPEASGKTHQGTLELVESKSGVHVTVQIPQMPQYHERVLVDALVKKLSSEHGDPPKRKRADEDKDKGDSDGDSGKKGDDAGKSKGDEPKKSPDAK
jgi:hypothetical protein